MNLDLLDLEGQRKRRRFSPEVDGFNKNVKEVAVLETEQDGKGHGLTSPPVVSSIPLDFAKYVATATKTKVCVDLIEENKKRRQALQETNLVTVTGSKRLFK